MAKLTESQPNLAVFFAILFCVSISHSYNLQERHVPTGQVGDSSLFVGAAELEGVRLTGKLVSWISAQCEQMIEEMDAIIRLEAVESAQRFSVVNYLRYLALYDQLSIVAKRTDVDKFQWIARKVKAFSRAHGTATSLLLDYVQGLDAALAQIEANEKRSRQDAVNKDWALNYETLNYIATHAPKDSQLAADAFGVLQKSPDGTEDRKRSTRYSLLVRVN